MGSSEFPGTTNSFGLLVTGTFEEGKATSAKVRELLERVVGRAMPDLAAEGIHIEMSQFRDLSHLPRMGGIVVESPEKAEAADDAVAG